MGIPGVGLVAFDVKAKTVYPEAAILDLAEIQKLRTFARLFHLTVYFACLDREGGTQGYGVWLNQLNTVPVSYRKGSRTLALPIADALPVSLSEPFYTAFVRAVTLEGMQNVQTDSHA